MKRFFALFCPVVVLLAASLFAIAAAPARAFSSTHSTSLLLPESTVAQAAPPATSAASFALLDPVSGALLAEHDASTRRPMASTTKIMTALVILEHCTLDSVVTVAPEAVGTEGSSVYLYAGERITVRDLLYALLLSSANDAAVALAIHAAGSIEGFADLMNAKAAELGLSDTHFCNPHGLHHNDHYTTARDLARLTAAALQNPVFAEIVATKRYTPAVGENGAARLFLNHNRLLRTYVGCIGVKTGFTKAGGRCLVSAARKNGLTLIAVTLNDPNDWRDHTALLDWGFSQYIAFAPTPQELTLPVVSGTSNTVNLIPVGTLSLTLPAHHPKITCTVEAPRFLYGGLEKGTQCGRIVYKMGSTVLGEIPLVAASDVPREAAPSLWARIKKLFE